MLEMLSYELSICQGEHTRNVTSPRKKRMLQAVKLEEKSYLNLSPLKLKFQTLNVEYLDLVFALLSFHLGLV